MKTRTPRFAGMFYPASAEEISRRIDSFLQNVPPSKLAPKALIVPHAAHQCSGQVAAYAYKLLQNCSKKKFLILGPSHAAYFQGAAADVNDCWETPLGRVKIAANNFPKMKEAHVEEHCLEVQVPFLQRIVKDFEILPLAMGDASPKETAKQIIPLLDEFFLIISSDLSHFHDYETAVEMDKRAITAVEKLDSAAFAGQEACGKLPILTAMEIARQLNWECRLLEYKNSGDVLGDKSRVVGYASLAFY